MRFLSKAFVMIAIAASAFLLSADTVQAATFNSNNNNNPVTSINSINSNNNNNNNNNNPFNARIHLAALHSHALSHRDALLGSLRTLKFRTQTYQDCLGALSASTRTQENVIGCLQVQGAAAFETNCKADINSPACAVDINAASKLYGVSPTSPGSGTLPQSCAKAIAGGSAEDSAQCAKDLGLEALPQSCLVKPPQMEKCITDVLRDLQNAKTTTAPAATTKPPPMFIPKSCLITPPTADSVGRCGTEFGITIPAVCGAANFQLTQCSAELSAAIALKFSNNNNGGGGTGGGSDVSTQQCYQAIQSFSAAVNAKCKVVIDGLAAISNANIGDLINAQCAILTGAGYAECMATFNQDAVSGVQTACPNYNIGQILASAHGVVSVVQGPVAAMCVKDDQDETKPCLSTALAGFAVFDNAFTIEKINDALLSSMCKPCMMTVVNKIAALGGNLASSALSPLSNSIKYLQLICTKDPTDDTKYCMNVFSPIKTAFAKMAAGAVPTDSDFATMCSPCITALITKLTMMETIPGVDMEVLKALQKFCIRDGNNGGVGCGSAVFTQQTALGTALFKCMGSSCTAECRSAIQELYNTQSCCFASVGMQSMLPILSQVPSLKTFLPQVQAAASCVVDTSKQCTVPTATLPIELSLKNIDAAVAGKALVNTALAAALKKDLSLLLGVDVSAILIGAFSPAVNGGTKVLVSISVDAALQASYQNAFNQQLKRDGGVPLQHTAQTAEANQAKVVDAEPVSASGNPAPPTTSGSVSMMGTTAGSIVSITMVSLFFIVFVDQF